MPVDKTVWEVKKYLTTGGSLWLFLDYDGTLAGFAPTPDHIFPDPATIDLISRLAGLSRTQVVILSGRRLAHILKLVPVDEIWRAGTYGIELLNPEGQYIERVPFESIEPIMEKVKLSWQELIDDREGFYLEDKRWCLAIHARFAPDSLASKVLAQAQSLAWKMIKMGDFRVTAGHKFLEIGPAIADKGNTVQYLLGQNGAPDILPVYIGDDERDEEAFEAIQERGGVTFRVASASIKTRADHLLANPDAVREWLRDLLT